MSKLLDKIKNKIIPKHPLLVEHEKITKSMVEGLKEGMKGWI